MSGGSIATSAGHTLVTVSDGYVMVGSIQANDLGYLYLLKTDPEGNEVWNRTYSDQPYYYSPKIAAVSGGFIVMSGARTDELTGVSLRRFNMNGTEVWNNTYSVQGKSYNPATFVVVPDGYVVAGRVPTDRQINTPYFNHTDIFLLKTDLDGRPLWAKDYEGSGMDEATAVAAVSDGYFVSGFTGVYLDDGDVNVVKADTEGNREWNRTFRDGPVQVGEAMVPVSDGYVIAGQSWHVHGYREGENGVYLLKIDPAGNEVWNRTHVVSWGNDMAKAMAPAGNDFIVAGVADYYRNKSVFLLKASEDGEKIWNKTYPVYYGGEISTVIADSDGYVVAENTMVWTQTGNISRGAHLFKTDLGGNLLWNKTYSGFVVPEKKVVTTSATPTPIVTPVPTVTASPVPTPTPAPIGLPLALISLLLATGIAFFVRGLRK